jgi:predicted nucleic acid-binding protein
MPLRDPRDRRVVIDANALYAMPLADTLLTAAMADNRLFQLRWSADLLQEVRETMERHGLSATAVERRIGAMAQTFVDEEVRGYQQLIPHLQLPDPDDRHVLAAAIQAQAEVIVTDNLKDFPPALLAPYGLSAQSPSEFLTGLATQFPEQMLAIVHDQADRLQHPAITFDQLVRVLEQYAPDFSRLLYLPRDAGAPASSRPPGRRCRSGDRSRR